mgnify:CR=1 FL=1
MTAPMYLPRFFVKQKLTMMVNRYEVLAAAPDGTPGELMAVAEQKRFAFKEQVTFYSDSSRSRAVFGFKARSVMDLNAGYDVTDESGAVLPGVTVTAPSPVLIEKERVPVTDSEGRFVITQLRPGEYKVTFALDGFSTGACTSRKLGAPSLVVMKKRSSW